MQATPPRTLLPAVNQIASKDANFNSLYKSSAYICHGNFCPLHTMLCDSVLVQTSTKNIYCIIYKASQSEDLPRNLCKWKINVLVIIKLLCVNLKLKDLLLSLLHPFYIISSLLSLILSYSPPPFLSLIFHIQFSSFFN